MTTTPVSPQRLAWLTGEVGAWQSSGLVDADTATRILGGYAASRRFSLARLLLGLGGAFVGVGLLWLVAANLDELAPAARFVVVATLWLALLAGGELLAGRGPALLAGSVRLVAALTSGAVIFQAAQSLQVPAFEPRLVGLWGVSALVHAYASRARGPLLVGMSALSGWVLWQGLLDDATFLRVVLILLATGVVSLAVAVLHDRWLPAFAGPWRHTGMAFTLVGLFVSALPDTGGSEPGSTPFLVALGAVAVVATASGLRIGSALARWEISGAAAAAAVGVLLALWEPGSDPDRLGVGDLAHAAVCVIAYVALAVGVAALGTLRDSWVLTATAAVALVVFTSFQSFAVFAAIVDGAWLFLLVGLVFLATGFVFDRARRTLASELADGLADPTGAQS